MKARIAVNAYCPGDCDSVLLAVGDYLTCNSKGCECYLVTNVSRTVVADWKSDYDTLLSKLYQKDEEIAELEHHNELLRAVAISAKSLFNENSYLPLSEWHLKLMNATQAAIDGGALDKDGEK